MYQAAPSAKRFPIRVSVSFSFHYSNKSTVFFSVQNNGTAVMMLYTYHIFQPGLAAFQNYTGYDELQ
jgi:hypothetical protein